MGSFAISLKTTPAASDGSSDRGSSIERGEVDLRARVYLEQPPGGRPRRPREFAVRLKLARKLLSVIKVQRRISSLFNFYGLTEGDIKV